MQGRNLRGALGLILTALSLSSNVVVPLLDRDTLSPRTTVESQHDAATCTLRHDHTICTQIGANLSLTSRTQDHHVVHAFRQAVLPHDAPRAGARAALEGRSSRAPPRI